MDGQGARYQIWIDFTQTEATKVLEASCSCPFFESAGPCKHLWASIIRLQRLGFSDKVPGKGPLLIPHARGRKSRTAPSAPTPVSLPANTNPASVGDWLARLDEIQGKGHGARTSSGMDLLAAFVISADQTVATGKLVLDFWARRRGQGSSAGSWRPTQVSERDISLLAELRDQEIVALLMRTGNPKGITALGSPCTRFSVDSVVEAQVLTTLAGSGRLFLSSSPGGAPDNVERPLRMDRGRPWDVALQIEAGARYRLTAQLRREHETLAISEPVAFLRSGLILGNEQIGRLTEPQHAAWLRNLSRGELSVTSEQVDILLKRILSDPHAPPITWPDGLGWKRTLIEPVPRALFTPLGNDRSLARMTVTVSFDYAERTLALADPSESLVDIENKQVYPRNRAFEEAALTQALELLRDPTGTIPLDDLQRACTALSDAGWRVFVEGQRIVTAGEFSLNVSSGTDWFDVTMEASFNGSPLRREEILAALDERSTVIRLKDGSIGLLPEDWVERYATLKSLGRPSEEGGLRFQKSQGILLNAALGDEDDVREDKAFESFRARILKYDLAKTSKAPTGFKGKLRQYQKEGLTWLGFLEEFQSGGILADDMGLGKTIQILAFLLSRRKKSKLPSLVVAPKSLVFNWIDEAAKFAPTLKVVRYVGDNREKAAKEVENADLWITTYGTLRSDIEKLRHQDFDVAVIDEAQGIKNPKSLSAIACKQLRATYRLALTGTPIENSLGDLLSILEFTNPGLLRFTADDIRPELARLLRPFMLRRTKAAVLTELPEKSEQVLFCEMGPDEAAYYAVIRDRYRESIEASVKKNGLAKSKLHILEALLRLRQAACHAGLVDETQRSKGSAKLDLLVNQLKAVLAEGHKALVFSQFTTLLGLVKTALDAEGIQYEYLDGQTDDRKTPVERFQSEGGAPVFLISLKAGGTGLNLTAADYVFILDPWWNPAVEAQAIGRSHRMGQQQKVFAYRMVARGTVEEKILELQKTKKDLAESIVEEDKDFLKKLTGKDLQGLLGD